MNLMSLESKVVKESIHTWIDLIFGVNQQNNQQNNMFKPLSDEVNIVRI